MFPSVQKLGSHLGIKVRSQLPLAPQIEISYLLLLSFKCGIRERCEKPFMFMHLGQIKLWMIHIRFIHEDEQSLPMFKEARKELPSAHNNNASI